MQLCYKNIEFLGPDTQKKNRTLQYNLNWGRIFNEAGGASSTMQQRRNLFETTLNAEILLENCEGNEIQGAEFKPRTEGYGKIIWYGAGVYDWYAPGTGNNNNVKKITENSLLYLAEINTLSVHNTQNETQTFIYPNPVTDIINVHTDGETLTEIYDLNGRKLISTTAKKIDVQKLTSGVYTAKILIKKYNNIQIIKLIKK